ALALERHRDLGLLDEDALLLLRLAVQEAHAHGHAPALVRLSRRAERKVAGLLQGQGRRLALLTADSDVDERHAGLKEEGLERRRDVLTGGFGQRRHEVLVGRAAEAMLLQVKADAGLERLFAEPALEHRQHAATL